MGKEIEKSGFQKVLSEIDEAVKPYNFADGVLPGILIYDDTLSCGTYQLGIVDCSGESRKNDNNVEPVFTIRVNGCEQPEENISGDLQGVMKESAPTRSRPAMPLPMRTCSRASSSRKR